MDKALNSDYENHVAVFGGESSVGMVAQVSLIDPRVSGGAIAALDATLSTPRTELSAVLTPGDGKVLVAGGSTEDGAPSGAAETLDVQASGVGALVALDSPCVEGSIEPLCARRARHTATLSKAADGLDVVVLWGGVIESVSAAETPGATPTVVEVYHLEGEAFVPVDAGMATGLSARVGHTATTLDCLQPPCKTLVLGGREGVSTTGSTALPSQLFTPGTLDGSRFLGTIASLAADPATVRYGHAAAILHDRVYFVTGGLEPSAPHDAKGASILSFCRDDTAAAVSDGATCTDLFAPR